jgi:antitoxin (DNA-binding transcriptional repressor) of toxin-antitoxin stability system
MTIVTIHKTKTTLSQLIKRGEAGEVIEIARGNEPVALLTPLHSVKAKAASGKRKPDGLENLAGSIPDAAFFDPLPEDELKLWEGGD